MIYPKVVILSTNNNHHIGICCLHAVLFSFAIVYAHQLQAVSLLQHRRLQIEECHGQFLLRLGHRRRSFPTNEIVPRSGTRFPYRLFEIYAVVDTQFSQGFQKGGSSRLERNRNERKKQQIVRIAMRREKKSFRKKVEAMPF